MKKKSTKETGLTVNLNVFDRLNIQTLSPKEVDFITADIYSDIKKKVSITQEEIKSLGLNIKEDNITMSDLSKIKPKKINFTDLEIDVLKMSANKLNKSKGFDEHMHSTCKLLGMKREDFEFNKEEVK